MMIQARNISANGRVGTLFIQGGGNGLEGQGVRGTMDAIEEGLREIREKNRLINIVLVGILRRPKEGWSYEKIRLATNAEMEEMTEFINREYGRRGIKPISFIDLDDIISTRSFEEDGWHLQEN